MRRLLELCAPMMALLLLAACGGAAAETETETADLRDRYHDMTGCSMEAAVTCDWEGAVWEAALHCEYVPGKESTVEVLSPETIAGVKALLTDTDWRLEYQGDSLNIGVLSEEEISPAVCLPRLMSALRDGWLLEENPETWDGVPCLRLTVDQTGEKNGKILSTLWLRREDGTPLRGEIAVEDAVILTAEFTSFSFYENESGSPEAEA